MKNLTREDPAELGRNYINLVRIEESFRTLKGVLVLRPIFHQNDNHIGRELRMKRYTKPVKVHQLLPRKSHWPHRSLGKWWAYHTLPTGNSPTNQNAVNKNGLH